MLSTSSLTSQEQQRSIVVVVVEVVDVVVVVVVLKNVIKLNSKLVNLNDKQAKFSHWKSIGSKQI